MIPNSLQRSARRDGGEESFEGDATGLAHECAIEVFREGTVLAVVEHDAPDTHAWDWCERAVPFEALPLRRVGMTPAEDEDLGHELFSSDGRQCSREIEGLG